MSLESIRKRRDVLDRAKTLGMFSNDVTRDYDALLAVAEAARQDMKTCGGCLQDTRGYCYRHSAVGAALEALEAQP
jgi:hypothetical protein